MIFTRCTEIHSQGIFSSFTFLEFSLAMELHVGIFHGALTYALSETEVQSNLTLCSLPQKTCADFLIDAALQQNNNFVLGPSVCPSPLVRTGQMVGGMFVDVCRVENTRERSKISLLRTRRPWISRSAFTVMLKNILPNPRRLTKNTYPLARPATR